MRLVPVFFLCAVVGSAQEETPPDYVDALIAQAEAEALHTDPYWQLLLHYESTFGGVKSRVDDPAFFAAAKGKTDPRAELHATLRAFFLPPAAEPRAHPVCRFAARFAWLSERLGMDPGRLPVPACEPFQRVLDHLQPESVSLIYPAAFINSPASMFGHTLLVFDSKNKDRLLARAVNYAALTRGETFGPWFTFKGIAGLYRGYYSIGPYYDRVETYTDIHHRDMWEYELDFTQEEVERVIAHIWELQNIYSRYFFFTENCSFNLLYLLDAGRPSLRLSEGDSLWVIPIDTVKAVRKKEVFREVSFRPSKSTTIHHLAAQMPDEDSSLAREVALGGIAAGEAEAQVADSEGKILLLDLAAEYTQYLYTDGTLTRDEYAPRFLQILRRRSKLGRPGSEIPAPEPSHPDEGHDAARLQLGAGLRRGEPFAQLGLRAAYHELIDPPAGYIEGAQILFFPTEIRYYTEMDRLELERFDLVDVVSLSPRGKFFKPTSWAVRGGARQMDFRAQDDRLVAYVHSRAGLSWSHPRTGLAAVLFDTEFLASGDIEDTVLLGAGPSLSWVTAFHPRWTSRWEAEALRFPWSEAFWTLRARWDQRFFFTRNSGMRLSIAHETNDDFSVNEGSVGWAVYF